MKKNLAKKIVLGLLTGAVLMSSSVAWAGLSIGPKTKFENNGADGNSSSASGIAIGSYCGADGEYSIVIGCNNKLNEEISYAKGKDNIVIGRGSEAGNYGNNEPFSGAIAIGSESKANGKNSIALGYGAVIETNKSGSVALGAGSVASDNYVVSVGNGNGVQKIYRKIVNVADGTIGEDSHDTVTGGQLFEIYGTGRNNIQANGSKLIKDMNLTDAVVALDGAVQGKADKATTLEGYGITNAYTKDEADATFVKIENNKIDTNILIVENTESSVKTNTVTISADDGITVGKNSTRMDSTGFYAGGSKPHNYDNAMAAMTDDGKIKGAGGKFEVGTKGEIKAASGSFKVDDSGNVTAEKVTAKEVVAENLYTKDDIDGMLGGSNASISGINQRLDKTNAKINKVGAGAAALAALHPLEYDPDDKLTFSAGMGNYAGENAAALGAFYRPNEKFMVSLGGTMGNGENMVNLGLSIGLDKPNGYAKLSKRELIQKVNAMEAKYEAVEAEKEAMKAEMAEMKAMLQAILAKK